MRRHSEDQDQLNLSRWTPATMAMPLRKRLEILLAELSLLSQMKQFAAANNTRPITTFIMGVQRLDTFTPRPDTLWKWMM